MVQSSGILVVQDIVGEQGCRIVVQSRPARALLALLVGYRDQFNCPAVGLAVLGCLVAVFRFREEREEGGGRNTPVTQKAADPVWSNKPVVADADLQTRRGKPR